MHGFWYMLVLFIAVTSTALWLNIVITEGFNSRVNVYATKQDNDKSLLVSKTKNVLIVIASLFWSIFFTYFV